MKRIMQLLFCMTVSIGFNMQGATDGPFAQNAKPTDFFTFPSAENPENEKEKDKSEAIYKKNPTNNEEDQPVFPMEKVELGKFKSLLYSVSMNKSPYDIIIAEDGKQYKLNNLIKPNQQTLGLKFSVVKLDNKVYPINFDRFGSGHVQTLNLRGINDSHTFVPHRVMIIPEDTEIQVIALSTSKVAGWVAVAGLGVVLVRYYAKHLKNFFSSCINRNNHH